LSEVDIVLCIILLIGAFVGYKEGFLVGLFSFLALVLGVLGGFKLMGWAMIMLADNFNVDEKVLPYFAFAAVFIAIVIAVRLLGAALKASLDKTFLGRIDQFAGSLLGILKTAFLLSVMLWLLESFTFHLPDRWTENSIILKPVAVFAPTLTRWLSEIFPVFRDVF
jgi:membrane protein required for colicin V production